MPDVISERDLVLEFRTAKQLVDTLSSQLETAKKRLYKAEATLIEYLDAKGAVSTAKYDGVGHITLQKPRVFANYTKENEDTLFSFLREIGRDDLIKENIHRSSLSSFVSERIEQGEDVPPCINYYLKRTALLYAGKE